MRANLTADQQRQVTQQTCVADLGQFLGELAQAGALYRYKWAVAPAAKSATNILNAVALIAGAQAGYVTGLPVAIPTPRNVRVTITLGGGTQHTAKAVVVYGTDIKGNAISESLDISTLATASIVVGALCFASVTAVDLPAQTQAGDAISVGTGDKLGVDQLLFTAMLIKGVHDNALPLQTADTGTLVADSAVLAKNGYTPSSVPNAALLYRIAVLLERD